MDKLIPTRYDGQVELGGSTKPWKVFAIIESEIDDPVEIPYIVKLFSPATMEQYPGIAKEFICNNLAGEFDLLVPKPGLINLNDEEFLSTLDKKDINVLNQRHKGETFASRYLSGALVNEQIKDELTDIEERAMIYAFDCFILNSDRWGFRKKANLMIRNNEFMLIDHELSLPFIDNYNPSALEMIFKSFEKQQLIYPYEKHLFFNSLKNYPENKENIFNTFQEYLININIPQLQAMINELKENNIDVGSDVLLYRYIREMKQQSDKFCKALLRTIL